MVSLYQTPFCLILTYLQHELLLLIFNYIEAILGRRMMKIRGFLLVRVSYVSEAGGMLPCFTLVCNGLFQFVEELSNPENMPSCKKHDLRLAKFELENA
ncbi:hypothetical protein CR513_36447, partial [Mucuna pruriens]